jgi:hypothetical protein
MITWTGCDSAIVGDKLVEHFVSQGMTDEEAIEWIDFNILGAYVGEETPMLLYKGDILTCEEMLNA